MTFDEEELKKVRGIVEETGPEGAKFNEMMDGMVVHRVAFHRVWQDRRFRNRHYQLLAMTSSVCARSLL